MKVQISLTHQERNLFVKELNQHIEYIEKSLIDLEQGYKKELIEQLFRSFHTIKGNAGMIDFSCMQQISSETEHVLEHFKQNGLNITEEISNALFDVIDYIKELSLHLLKSNFEIDEDVHAQHMEAIKNINQIKTPEIKKTNNTVQNVASSSLGFDIEVYLSKNADMPAVTIYQLLHLLEELNIPFDSTPSKEEINQGIANLFLRICFLQPISEETMKQLFQQINIIDDIQYIKKIFPIKKREKDKRSLEVRELKNTKEELSEVQVNINQLDDLINQLGEIMIDRNQIVDALATLEEKYPFDPDILKLAEVASKLWKSSYRLQSQLLNIRSIPLHSILDKYNRLAREIAKKVNKKIKLETTGQELRLDRIILNYLNDILIHLVRNSIDHGLESPKERIQLGKNPVGTIKIVAEQKNNKAIFYVSDDGKGIDPNMVINKIIKKNLLPEEEVKMLTKDKIIDYIFHSGFSTKDNVSDISGRGVGMDVVKNTIQKLGGGITISSELNKGTTFKITLPLTMAIIKGLVTEIENKIFIIPITYIEEIIDIYEYKTKFIHEHPHIIFRDEIIPVIHLKEMFFNKKSKISNHTKGVVLSFSDKNIILIIDKIIDEQEIVIKNIDFVDQLYYLIHSATILGTGAIGLILDISALFDEVKRKYNLH